MRLLGIVACLVLTTNSSTLNGKCEGDNSAPNLVVEIPHPDAKSAKLLHLKAGKCDEISFKEFGGGSVFNEFKNIVEVTIPIVACGMRESVYHGLYQATANVTLGTHWNGQKFVFRNVIVTAECGVKTTYHVNFDYQNITTQQSDQDCQLIDGSCIFPSYDEIVELEIKEYTDSGFNTEVTTENRLSIAGQQIYLSMRAVSINENNKFAVTECSILTSDGSRIILFAPGAETSPTCKLDSIGLVASYDGNNFNFQHILFQLNDAGYSSYKLECTAEICKRNDPVSKCNQAVLPCILNNHSENADSNRITNEINRIKHAYMQGRTVQLKKIEFQGGTNA